VTFNLDNWLLVLFLCNIIWHLQIIHLFLDLKQNLKSSRHNLSHFGGSLDSQSLDWYWQTTQYRKIHKLNTTQKSKQHKIQLLLHHFWQDSKNILQFISFRNCYELSILALYVTIVFIWHVSGFGTVIYNNSLPPWFSCLLQHSSRTRKQVGLIL